MIISFNDLSWMEIRSKVYTYSFTLWQGEHPGMSYFYWRLPQQPHHRRGKCISRVASQKCTTSHARDTLQLLSQILLKTVPWDPSLTTSPKTVFFYCGNNAMIDASHVSLPEGICFCFVVFLFWGGWKQPQIKTNVTCLVASHVSHSFKNSTQNSWRTKKSWVMGVHPKSVFCAAFRPNQMSAEKVRN